MRFAHDFASPGAPDTVFAVLADPARVAPCMPGAVLDAAPGRPIEAGDELAGRVELRIGPVKTRFAAQVRVLDLDRVARRSVLAIRAEDERGNGSAEATITLGAEPDGEATIVRTAVELDVRGRIATFGGAAVEAVSSRMLERFAENLAAVVDPRHAAVEPPASGSSREAEQVAAVRTRSAAGPAEVWVWPGIATVLAFVCGLLIGRTVLGAAPRGSSAERAGRRH
jgi:carbon monoxide dehydrogenase subunit G